MVHKSSNQAKDTIRSITNGENLIVHGGEGVELGVEVIHGVKGLQEMSQRQRLLPSMGQRCGRPNGILDLPAVDIPHGELPDFLRGEGYANLGQEGVPNLGLGWRIEIVEVKSDVGTRAERIIDDLDSVSREEENTTVVLEVAEAEDKRTRERWVTDQN